MLGIMRNGLMRSPFVVGMVIGSMAFGVFTRRAEGRSAGAAEPPTVVIREAPIPDFDPEEATRQVLSLGFGLEYRPGQMGLALEGPPEQGVLDLIVVDESLPGVPVGVGTFLNPHVFLLPGLGSGFELPGMDEAASDAARQAGLTIRFSIMAGLVVTPLWTGAVCAFAVETTIDEPTSGLRAVTSLVPVVLADDLCGAMDVAQRLAGLLNGEWPEASLQDASGGTLTGAQVGCMHNCENVYRACLRLAAANLSSAAEACARDFLICVMAAVVGCAATGSLYTLCVILAQAICAFITASCLKSAINVYEAAVAACKAALRACLAGCGIHLIET
jgi:hypothetical protein